MIFITLERQPKYQLFGRPKFLKFISSILLLHIYINQKKILINFVQEVTHIETKFLEADHPLHFMDSIIRKF